MPHKIETGQYALDFRYRVIAFYILLHFQLNKDLKCEIAFMAFCFIHLLTMKGIWVKNMENEYFSCKKL